jgi:hypothetical protein
MFFQLTPWKSWQVFACWFDEILGLDFDLGNLTTNIYYIKRVKFVEVYQNDSYNKNIVMGKTLRGNKPISHIQKTRIPKKMWNSKTLKIQKTF